MKSRLGAWALALGLLAGPSIGWASDDYASGDGWSVFQEDHGCGLAISYDGGVELYLSYTVGNNSIYLAVLNPAYKSIKVDQEYPVEMLFLKGERADEGWGEIKMHGLLIHERPAIGTWLNADEILADFKRNTALLLTRNNGSVLVENLDIKGSKSPIAKLERCSQEVHKQNPVDPFAE